MRQPRVPPLLRTIKTTGLILAGRPKAQMAETTAAIDKKELPGFVVSFRDGMNRISIASPLLFVGRDAIETWHGSDDEYREVGFEEVCRILNVRSAHRTRRIAGCS